MEKLQCNNKDKMIGKMGFHTRRKVCYTNVEISGVVEAHNTIASLKNNMCGPFDNSNAYLYVIVDNCIGRQQRAGIDLPAFLSEDGTSGSHKHRAIKE
ncbi:hypothetical protein GJ496_000406 [Pomphorhynchus laevis]|nr:hypothetical protein GJ496_000406 [Pomphorhynchus laevis]